MDKIWFRAAIIRAIRTVAQAALAAIGSSAVLAEVNWEVVASTAALSGIISLFMSVAGLPEVDKHDGD